MGNICFHHIQEPSQQGQPISAQRSSSQLNQTSSSENPLTTSGNQYKENVISEMKSKIINARRLCRQSKVIVEQREQSVYTRDTEHRQNYLSDISGNYETVNLVNCQSAAVSTFIQNQQVGQRIRIGDTVLLKNLKEKAFLHCKYQRLKKLSKQNLVKLEQERDEMNEMYLTWKLVSESDSGKDEVSEVLNQQKIKIQHSLTGCFLQTSKSYKFEQSQAVGSCGQVVSCGQANKITKDQIWQVECLQSGQQYVSVNDLFRVKHCETGTYFASYQQQVCCLDECDLERHRVFKQSDQGFESDVHSEIINNLEVNSNEHDETNRSDQKEENTQNQIEKDQNKEQLINKLDSHDLDEEKNSEIAKQLVKEQVEGQTQGDQKINEIETMEEGKILNEKEIQQNGTNGQLQNENENETCQLNQKQPENCQDKDNFQLKKEQFLHIVKDAEIWYIAEVFSRN